MRRKPRVASLWNRRADDQGNPVGVLRSLHPSIRFKDRSCSLFVWDSIPIVPENRRVKKPRAGKPFLTNYRLTAGAIHHQLVDETI